MGYEVKKWNHYSIFYQVFLTCCIDFANIHCKILTSLCTKNIIYYFNICSRNLWWIGYLKSDFRVSGLSQIIDLWQVQNSTDLSPIPSYGVSKKPKTKFWVSNSSLYKELARGKGIWNIEIMQWFVRVFRVGNK